MKKGIFTWAILAIAVVFLINSVAAEIVILQNPSGLYNLGDIMSVPIKITSLSETGAAFTINLICNGVQTEVHKEYIFISAGDEADRNPPIPLIKSFIGNSTGDCRLKYSFGSVAKLSSDFVISELINVNVVSQEKEFAPEKEITIEGTAKKENGKEANGFVDLKLTLGGENSFNSISASSTVKNGLFTLKFSLPKGTASGQYLLEINAYEKDSNGETTNNGFSNYNILLTQVPTNLEIFIEDREIAPGETLRTKAILRDQTGQQMSSTAILTVLNNKGKIVEQVEIGTDEILEIDIPENNLPSQWTIKASSNEISSQSVFNIESIERIETEIIDKTLIVTNTGNVPYIKTVLVKIGENSLNIDVMLNVGESQKYVLSAPDGEYDVDVVVGGESSMNEGVFLTGKAVDVRESGVSLENNTLIWIIAILILGFFGTKLFRKWKGKSFFGYIPSERMMNMGSSKKEVVQLKRSSVVTRNKAELELSIKGDQQDVSVVCMRIKNIDKLKESKTDYEQVLQSIVNEAESQKAYIYGAQENLFFIYAPIKTKTFRNEKPAINLAQKMSGIISSYNKMAKEKILAGISVNYGTIVASSAPQQGNVLKFMSLGTLMNSSKKLASLAEEDVLLSDKVRNKLGGEIKTQKKEVSGTTAYTIREMKDDEKSKEFIRRFMDRMDKGQ